jgi:hypothetical protein
MKTAKMKRFTLKRGRGRVERKVEFHGRRP